jgi:hypothetical protein
LLIKICKELAAYYIKLFLIANKRRKADRKEKRGKEREKDGKQRQRLFSQVAQKGITTKATTMQVTQKSKGR